MPVVPAPSEWTHTLSNACFRSLATPSRGSSETSVWCVRLLAGAAGAPHRVTREEVFVVLSGSVAFTADGETRVAGPGDAIVAPPDVEFAIRAFGDEPAELVCCLPVGGQARLGSGLPFTPPWAL